MLRAEKPLMPGCSVCKSLESCSTTDLPHFSLFTFLISSAEWAVAVRIRLDNFQPLQTSQPYSCQNSESLELKLPCLYR